MNVLASEIDLKSIYIEKGESVKKIRVNRHAVMQHSVIKINLWSFPMFQNVAV